jgi:septal ring factor EnvC (AmiA/AmiB activator)
LEAANFYFLFRADGQETKGRVRPCEKCKDRAAAESELKAQLHSKHEELVRIRCELAVSQQQLEQLQRINENLHEQIAHLQSNRFILFERVSFSDLLRSAPLQWQGRVELECPGDCGRDELYTCQADTEAQR